MVTTICTAQGIWEDDGSKQDERNLQSCQWTTYTGSSSRSVHSSVSAWSHPVFQSPGGTHRPAQNFPLLLHIPSPSKEIPLGIHLTIVISMWAESFFFFWQRGEGALPSHMEDPSCICDLHCSSQHHQIINPLSGVGDWTRVLMLSHSGNSKAES